MDDVLLLAKRVLELEAAGRAVVRAWSRESDGSRDGAIEALARVLPPVRVIDGPEE